VITALSFVGNQVLHASIENGDLSIEKDISQTRVVEEVEEGIS
jgi:hypothetical protein